MPSQIKGKPRFVEWGLDWAGQKESKNLLSYYFIQFLALFSFFLKQFMNLETMQKFNSAAVNMNFSQGKLVSSWTFS